MTAFSRILCACLMALAVPASAQIPPPPASEFDTVEDAQVWRDRAQDIYDKIDSRNRALVAAANDTSVVVISDRGDYRVVTAGQLDEFVARVQLVYLLNPELFRDIVPQLAAAAGLPEFVVESALEGDANELAVSTLMAQLREKMGVTSEQAKAEAEKYDGILDFLEDYVEDVDARIAQIKNAPAPATNGSAAPATNGEAAPGIGAVGPDGMPITRDFQNPMESGAPLDHCLIFPDCDSSAANRFCKNQGMLMAVYWEVAQAPKTWVPGLGRHCEATIPGQCVAFTMVRCRY